MTASRWLSLALGLAFAPPVAAYAYDGVSPRLHHHHRPAYHREVDQSAVATARGADFPGFVLWSPSYTTSHEQYEIEGLTRNPDDCAKYGCIGNN